MSITIITPTLNAASHVAHCLESVANQSYRDVEHIVIDGGSIDGTLDILQSCPTVSSFVEPGIGIYGAMNLGLQRARGDWILFLGADDLLFQRSTLEMMTQYLTEEWEVVYGNVIFRGSGERYSGPFDYQKIYSSNICHQSIFFRRSVFELVGDFNQEFPYLSDWEHNLRWFFNPLVRSKFVNETVALFDEAGVSGSHRDEVFYRQRRLIYLINALPFIPWKFALQVALTGLLVRSLRLDFSTAVQFLPLLPKIFLKRASATNSRSA